MGGTLTITEKIELKLTTQEEEALIVLSIENEGLNLTEN